MITIEVSQEEILEKIDSLSNKGKLEFIRDIDNQSQDWGFTKLCFEYFSEEMLQHFDADSFENAALRTLLLSMEE